MTKIILLNIYVQGGPKSFSLLFGLFGLHSLICLQVVSFVLGLKGSWISEFIVYNFKNISGFISKFFISFLKRFLYLLHMYAQEEGTRSHYFSLFILFLMVSITCSSGTSEIFS